MSAASDKPRGLGRGLSALLGESPAGAVGAPARAGAERRVPIEALGPGPSQSRRIFEEQELEALAESMRGQGMLQPILVRPDPGSRGRYQIVAGERRWRAAQKASLHEVPVVVLELSDRDALEVALIENVQRKDLNPLEEAEGYRRLIAEFGMSQEKVARAVGKSRSHVANMLRLLDLPGAVKELIDQGHLTMGHARALLGAVDPAALAKEVLARRLNVRQTERLAARSRARPAASPPAGPDPTVNALEREIGEKLGLEVKIRARGETGSLTVFYRSLDQLDELIARLRQP